MRRTLATIFAADIAQYSTHMEEHEASTLSNLVQLRLLMDPIIAKYNGRIANTAGDSVIAVFESPVEAVQAAIEIQEEHKFFNATVKEGERLHYRIGVNIGDVTVQPNGDVLGAGVNIAARLESIAAPGGICVSENVFDQVDRKIPTTLIKLGEHFVKNLDKPLKVYSIGPTGDSFGHRVQVSGIKLLKRPTTQLSIIALALAACILSIYLVLNLRNPIWASRTPERVSFKSLTKEQLLAKFDLITKGHFETSDYYVIRTWGINMESLEELARGLGGHVVAIGSAAENMYLFNLSLEQEGHWMVQDIADGTTQTSGPMIGFVQTPGSVEPDQGWHWINGEAVTYINWGRGSPSNSNGNQSLAQFRTNTNAPEPIWDDIGNCQDSVIIEVPVKG
ncbi:adenylate/guanylate cyclase domain-containing protein [Rhizobium johnstonii]|uniref:adenylate/guanylate cyclase domain-containing protein n=1 Tax=Rhizobium TaxID=379 RepID=UPI003F9579B3